MTTIFSPRRTSFPWRSRSQGDGRSSAPLGNGIRVEETVSILKPRDELYSFWRNFRNLPRFMKYLESVDMDEAGWRSRWVVRGPLNVRVSWDAEITADQPGEFIAWRSLPGSAVATQGEVHFEPSHGNRGTRVKVVMTYAPPGGRAGDAVAHLFGRSGDEIVREDVRRFKRLLETGEIPTTQGQPSGRGREAWEQTASMVVEHRLLKSLGWLGIGLGLTAVLAITARELTKGARS